MYHVRMADFWNVQIFDCSMIDRAWILGSVLQARFTCSAPASQRQRQVSAIL